MRKARRHWAQGRRGTWTSGGVRALAIAWGVSVMACGGQPSFEKSLDQMWQWDGGREAEQVLARLEGKVGEHSVPAAVGVTPHGLVGRTLPAGKVWTHEGEVDVLPTLVGDLVLFTDRGDLIALDVRNGSRRFTLPINERRLEGAGYDGKNIILLLVDVDDARQDQIRIVGPRGEDLFSATATARLGTPAAVGGIGLVPYSGQYVGALDLETHELIGRILLRDNVHTVRADEKGVFIYGAGVTRLDKKLAKSPDAPSLKIKKRNFPGEPVWPVDGSDPRPARARPVDIHAEPVVQEGTLQFADDTYVTTYYEILLGLDPVTSRIRWANHLPRPIAGGAPGRHGPTLCLENGSLVRVSTENGTVVPSGSLETKVKACVVTASDEPIPTEPRPALLMQLEEAITQTGPDMLAMQRILLEEIGRSRSTETTEALLAIAQNPLVSTDLVQRASRSLGIRSNGGEEMVKALIDAALDPEAPTAPDPNNPDPESPEPSEAGASIDPTADRRPMMRPPPVGALARALTRMKTPGAAAALAPYLDDPALPAGDALSIMTALGTLGGPEQVPAVQSFLSHYKNTGGEDALLDALVLAARFLFKHLDEEGRASLKETLDQSLTHPELRSRLSALKTPLEPPSEDKRTPSDSTDPRKRSRERK